MIAYTTFGGKVHHIRFGTSQFSCCGRQIDLESGKDVEKICKSCVRCNHESG